MMAPSNITDIGTAADFDALVKGKTCVVHFQAVWAPECQQMNEVLAELAKLHPNVTFAKLEAEDLAEVSEKCEIVAVPTFIFYKGGAKVDQLDGANAPELTKKVQKIAQGLGGQPEASGPLEPAAESEEALNEKLKTLINAAPVMLFMKGTPEDPKCGFSRKIVALLQEQKIEFSYFNILADDTVRQGLKKFSDWPTYPQLYAKGELIGGLDIVKEQAEAGELQALIKDESEEVLNKRLQRLIEQSPVMLFMKGTPEAPRCGFSRTIVGLLKEQGVKFGYYDILGDNDVRQGLKKYSDWPTFPQLYSKGELLGGLDIVKEMIESGEFEESL